MFYLYANDYKFTGSSKPPALLRLLSAIVMYNETVGVLMIPVTKTPVSTDIVKSAKKGTIISHMQPINLENAAGMNYCQIVKKFMTKSI